MLTIAAPGAFEPGHQVVQAQLLEALADRVELGGAVLDEVAALLDELERLAQAGVARVQPADDLLDPCRPRSRRWAGARSRSWLVRDLGGEGAVVEAQRERRGRRGPRPRTRAARRARSSTSA